MYDNDISASCLHQNLSCTEEKRSNQKKHTCFALASETMAAEAKLNSVWSNKWESQNVSFDRLCPIFQNPVKIKWKI